MHYLLREFCNSAIGRPFSSASKAELGAGLVAPASIASWVMTFHPELATRSSLHIAVLGAGRQDSFDDGCWYALLPWLLGNESMTLTTTLVGTELLTETHPAFESEPRTRQGTLATRAGKLNQRLAPATLVSGNVAQYLGGPFAQGTPTPDLFFMFNPGLEEINVPGHWFEPGQLDAVCRLGKPIGVASYSMQEYQTEQWVAKMLGFHPGDRLVVNPFCGMPTPVGQWAGQFWEIQPVAPLENFKPKTTDVKLYQGYDRACRQYIELQRRLPWDQMGQKISRSPRPAEPPQTLVNLPDDGVFVSLETGVLYRGDPKADSGPLESSATRMVSSATLASYPAGTSVTFEHYAWAFKAYKEAVQMVNKKKVY